jgi:hypothetical protein
VDAGVTLISLTADPADQNFDRLSKYEQRLHYTISRCLRELRTWRKGKVDEPELSPYRRLETIEEPGNPEKSNAQNEPTVIAGSRNSFRTMGILPMSFDRKHGQDGRGTGDVHAPNGDPAETRHRGNANAT